MQICNFLLATRPEKKNRSAWGIIVALILLLLTAPAASVRSQTPEQDRIAFLDNNDLRAGIRFCTYASRNAYDTLLQYAELGIARSQSRDKSAFAVFTYFKALRYYYANALPESRAAIQVSLQNATDIHYWLKTVVLLGGIALKSGHMDTAFNRYHATLRQAAYVNDTAVMLEAMAGLSWAYLELDQLEDARRWAYQAIDLTHSEKYLPEQLHAYNDIIPCFGAQKQYDSARRYIRIIKAGAVSVSSKVLLANALVFESYVKAETGNPQAAIDTMQKVIRLRKSIGAAWLLMADYVTLAHFYQLTKNYPAGVATAQTGLALVAGNQQLVKKLDLLKVLKANYEGMGKYQQALAAMEEAQAVKDQMLDVEKQKNLGELEVRYQMAEKDVRLARQASSLARQNLWITLTAGGALLIVLLLLFYFRNRKLRSEKAWQGRLLKSQASAAKAVVGAEEREKQKLSMALHDNIGQMLSAARLNLSALDGYAPIPEKGRQLLAKTTSLIDDAVVEIRHLSRHISPAMALKMGLKASLLNLIEKVDQSKTQIRLDITEDDLIPDKQKQLAIYRIIQESLQNALKHAGAKGILISVYREGSEIQVVVQDDGVGFDPEDAAIQRGQGLENIQSRVRLLQGRMALETIPGKGVRLQFYIPV